MAATIKTDTPGVYKRGSKYVISYRDGDGRQRWESFTTKNAARRAKRARQTAVDTGQHRPPCKLALAEYAEGWFETYQGRSGGIRERTRQDNRRDAVRYVLPFLGARRVTAIRRGDVAAFIAWLTDDAAQAQRHEAENVQRNGRAPLRDPGPMRDATVRRVLAVLSALMQSAVLDDLRPDNPVSRAVKPKRDPMPDPSDEDAEDKVKALTRSELAVFLDLVRPDWRPFFRLLAATGLRVGEALALDVAHLRLDGARPHVRVRRALGAERRAGVLTLVLGPPKTRHGHRDVPLPLALADELRAHVARLPEAHPVWGRLAFPSETGTPARYENLHRRVLAPAMAEAGVEWAGFHCLRHTFASLHIEAGTNVVKLSKLLGHHAPSFTLDVYSHMLDDGVGEPLDLDAELRRGANNVRTDVTGLGDIQPESVGAETP